MNLLHFPALFSDRGGMLAFMGLGVTSQALFFGLSAEQETLQVGLYSPEDGGRWWETVADGGRWWEMAGYGGRLWYMVRDGGSCGWAGSCGWITPNLNYLQVGLYSLGSMVFVACMQIARNFAWAFVTKLPRAKDRQLVLGINAAVYMGAKGIGAIASPFLEPSEVHTSAFRTLNLLGLSP